MENETKEDPNCTVIRVTKETIGPPQKAFSKVFADTGFTPTELDPNGKSALEPGSKLDSGKNRLGLVLGDFARALEAVGLVGTYGCQKYSESGWISVPEGQSRYTDALYRHLIAEAKGQPRDPETGLLHAAHTAWNALARLDLALRGGLDE